jgi:hypothetical protein
MNRNQKIALGCGGAGCLGLIVAVIAGCVFYFVYYAQSRRYSANSNYNFNINTNRNSNSNDNSDVTSNANNNSSNSSSTSASSISEDDKHKLYQAAAMSGDQDLIQRVSVKIGLMQEDYTPNPNYQSFLGEHVSWALRNRDFIVSLNTPDKARDYVNQNLPD